MLHMKSTFLVAALIISAASIAFAQSRPVHNYPGTVARVSASPDNLTPRETLRATFSDSGALFQTASCSSFSCLATPVTIYSYNLVCPVPAGSSCRYDIQIAGQVESGGNSVASGEDGLYQFFVDGVPPSGGGTDPNGFYSWQMFGPEFYFGTSYNVHSKVMNNSANQKHNVTVNLSCFEILGDSAGCFATSSYQTLVVRVWTP